jgi:hypothetical protein
MPIFDRVTQFSSESLKLTGGLLKYLDQSLKLEVEHAKAQRKKNCNNIAEKCSRDFLLLAEIPKTGDAEGSQSDVYEKADIMKMLLETNFWRNITAYMEENKKSSLSEQRKWQGFLSESIEPLLQELDVWSKDSANVMSRAANS